MRDFNLPPRSNSDLRSSGSLLGYYAAYGGKSLSTFWDNLSVPSNLEDGTDKLSRNVGKVLPLYAS